MGFLDKVKEKAQQFKEDNKNFLSTTKRINDTASFYGRVNVPATSVFKIDPDEDFCKGSYLSIENGKGVIYCTAKDDYVFSAEDIVSFKLIGIGTVIQTGNKKEDSLKFDIAFADGKKTTVHIIEKKVELFEKIMNL